LQKNAPTTCTAIRSVPEAGPVRWIGSACLSFAPRFSLMSLLRTPVLCFQQVLSTLQKNEEEQMPACRRRAREQHRIQDGYGHPLVSRDLARRFPAALPARWLQARWPRCVGPWIAVPGLEHGGQHVVADVAAVVEAAGGAAKMSTGGADEMCAGDGAMMPAEGGKNVCERRGQNVCR
jgi:hypothetical protein